ncbi:hypothetical protein O7599_21490 [Streptomyces sp. WMMC500]|uniref:hypothetical protein n=1 Tax=Streptomyces sp. WMMC500 TaxID=3015154 RepID=UPI00248A940D|nr:hypothetical protein [Streptomyces sp. WMMC500]WBB58215.1 hypothetical protein O7599_21490 [Streptomyces sp. WMMC500]
MMTDKQRTRTQQDERTGLEPEPLRTAVREGIRAAREEVRDDLRAELWRPPMRRTARLYAAAGTVALYAGGAAVALLVLLLALVMPAWAAALVITVALTAAAATLRNLARSPRPHHRRGESGGADAAEGRDEMWPPTPRMPDPPS